MRLAVATLLSAVLVLSACAAYAAVEVFAGLNWEDQPFIGYVSAKVYVDELGSLVVNSATRDDGSSGKIGTPWPPGTTAAESIGAAKLLASGPFPRIHVKVFDSRTTDNNGWAVVLEDDTGKILDFGARYYLSAIGWVATREYDGSVWTYQRHHDRNSGDKYYTTDFTQNPDGTISISCTEWFGGSEATVNWTTTLAYGNITTIYLTASSSTRVARDYKYTEFAIPEPGSLFAFGSALTALAGYALRRRRA